MSEIETTIVTVLREFFSQMKQWEIACADRDRRAKKGEITYESSKQQSAEELSSLFRTFVITEGEPRRSAAGVKYCRPPEYDESREQIKTITVEGDRATVVTQQTTGFMNCCVYTMSKVDTRWKVVDNRERIAKSGERVGWDL